jgi:hypothetical protein
MRRRHQAIAALAYVDVDERHASDSHAGWLPTKTMLHHLAASLPLQPGSNRNCTTLLVFLV